MYTTERNLLIDWCKGRLCSDCPVSLDNPEHNCGNGSQFDTTKPDGSYDMSDKEVVRAYQAAFGVDIDNYTDNCEHCAYTDCDIDEFPCTHCKQNFVYETEAWRDAVSQWTPKGEGKDNPVTHPSHYTQGDIQCIDAMESAFGKEAVATWCKLNAFKYIWREAHKNGMEDIDKAIWYLNKFKELSA